MGQPKDWLYFLTDEQGRSYYVNNGVVQPSGVPKPLRYTPDGWQDKSIKYARNVSGLGIWRTFTTPLKYVKDAAFIVRNQLYKYGTENKIYQVIHRLNKKFGGGWSYDFFYRGELDLSQADDSDTNISVNIMEGDLVKYFKANENTTYELDIDVPEAVMVKMDGLQLKKSASYSVLDIELIGPQLVTHAIPIIFLNQEGSGVGMLFETQSFGPITNARMMANGTGQDITFNINGNIPFVIKFAAFKYRVLIRKRWADGTLETLQTIEVNTDTNVNYNIPFDIDVTLSNGEELFFEGMYIANAVDLDALKMEYFEARVNVSFDYMHRVTYIKALRPLYVAQKLLDKMTGGGYTVTSTYLSTEWENLLITSGDGIRAYNESGSLISGYKPPKLKLSWSDFYDSYNVPCNFCEGIRNQTFFIEKKEAVFQPIIQQNMGEVSEFGVTTAKDFQYNVVKIGYPNSDTKDVNGKDEFNVTYTYTSPITRVNKSLDLVSKVIASMYEIEITRINLDGKPTTDDDNDNRLFFIHVEKSPAAGAVGEPTVYYKLLRNTYTSVTGLLSPSTAFNLELHPELCLYRHGNFLRSVFYWQDAKSLVYQTSDKNGNVVVMNGSTTYIGNKNIRIGSLAAPLFIPLTFKFKSPMPDDFITTMDNGPDGTFTFTYDGVMYYGFPMDVGIQPANRPAQECTLLCSPQTDLTNLITMSR